MIIEVAPSINSLAKSFAFEDLSLRKSYIISVILFIRQGHEHKSDSERGYFIIIE